MYNPNEKNYDLIDSSIININSPLSTKNCITFEPPKSPKIEDIHLILNENQKSRKRRKYKK